MAQPSIPGWATCNEHELACGSYEVALEGWRVQVVDPSQGDEPLYESPDEWMVQDAEATDIDQDGATELILLAWRQGNFGSSTPFWKENDVTSWTQHLFILRPTPTELKPVWMTSDLGMEVVELHASNNQIEIVEKDGTRTLWEWISWGLTLMEETPPGGANGEAAPTPST